MFFLADIACWEEKNAIGWEMASQLSHPDVASRLILQHLPQLLFDQDTQRRHSDPCRQPRQPSLFTSQTRE